MTDADADDFLARVNEIHAAVSGLREGKLDTNDVDKLIDKVQKQQPVEVDPEEEKKLRLEKDRKGYSGKGTGINFKWYCKVCQLEFKVDLIDNKCWKCEQSLLSNKQRNAELKSKVATLMEEKRKRDIKRKIMEEYKVKQKDNELKGITDYEKWNIWVEDSDSDNEPILPDNPAFKMMERDMDKKIAMRKERRRKADVENNVGNDYVRQKDWNSAIRQYSKAIELDRGCKKYYSNRAYAYLQINEYIKAIKDCDVVMEIYEYIDNNKIKEGDKVVLKSYMRRGSAKRGMKQYEDAVSDFEKALLIDPKNKQCKKLLIEAKEEIEVAKEEMKVRKESDETESEMKETMEKLKLWTKEEWEAKDINIDSKYPIEEAKILFSYLTTHIANNHNNHTYFRIEKGINMIIQMIRWFKDELISNGCQLLIELCSNKASANVILKEKIIIDLLMIQKKSTIKIPYVIQLLSCLSEREEGRKQLLEHTHDCYVMLLQTLAMNNTDLSGSHIITILTNLALEKKARDFLITFELAPYGNVLQYILKEHTKITLACVDPATDKKEDGECLVNNFIANMSVDPFHREHILKSNYFRKLLLSTHMYMQTPKIQNNMKYYNAMFGVFANLCLEKYCRESFFSVETKTEGRSKPQQLLDIYKAAPYGVQERILFILNRSTDIPRVLEQFLSANGVDCILDSISNIVQEGKNDSSKIVNMGKNDSLVESYYTLLTPSAKMLALACGTQTGINAVLQYKHNNTKQTGIDILVQMLCFRGLSMMIGNTCLVIREIAHTPTNVALLRSAVVPLIEILRGDDTVPHSNAVVALARLARDTESIKVVREMQALPLLARLGSKVINKK